MQIEREWNGVVIALHHSKAQNTLMIFLHLVRAITVDIANSLLSIEQEICVTMKI